VLVVEKSYKHWNGC